MNTLEIVHPKHLFSYSQDYHVDNNNEKQQNKKGKM